MSEKSDKLRAMLAKEKERRIKLNNRIEILERRIQEEDSAEVNEMVRTAKVTPEQLAALLRQSATATPNPAALSAVGATFEKEVNTDWFAVLSGMLDHKKEAITEHWQFCPKCNIKLYRMTADCTGFIHIKCWRCREMLWLSLSIRAK